MKKNNDRKMKKAIDVLTDTDCCPLCLYGGFWYVDPKTGRDAERDKRAKTLIKKILKIFTTAGLGCLLLSCFVLSGDLRASPSCMTRHEARARYPHKHIYWATADHCWGDHRIRRMRFRPRHVDPPRAAYARGQVPTTQQVFDKTPSTQAHKVIDLDAKLKDCCWPDLERDANGNVIEADYRTFNDRIRDVPLTWWQQ